MKNLKIYFLLLVFSLVITTGCAIVSGNKIKVSNIEATSGLEDEAIINSFAEIVANNIDPSRIKLYSDDESEFGTALICALRSKGFVVYETKEDDFKQLAYQIGSIVSDTDNSESITVRLYLGDQLQITRLYMRNPHGQLIAASPFNVLR